MIFDDDLMRRDKAAIEKCRPVFKDIEATATHNQWRVIQAFSKNRVGAQHLCGTTGYGYDDAGRDTLDRVFADIIGTQDALVRHTLASGTATITAGLFGMLRPGDSMLILTGTPYDTLLGVLGINSKSEGSLADFKIKCDIVPLKDGAPDIKTITKKLKEKPYAAAYIQRSRGYSLRRSLTAEEVTNLYNTVKNISSDTLVLVDNCYGIFTGIKEPQADLLMGSLIKNAGGGIAPCGGYLAGTKDAIKKCSYRLTAPGVGREIGATLSFNRELFMGLFNAPQVVAAALKTAVYAACLFADAGFEVLPEFDAKRGDIVQTVLLKNAENLISFCQGIQAGSPVDSAAAPYPAPMPGYDDQIIMAAGAFTGGSSIELSADGPLREPFAVYMQGGLNFDSGRYGVLHAAMRVFKNK